VSGSVAAHITLAAPSSTGSVRIIHLFDGRIVEEEHGQIAKKAEEELSKSGFEMA